MASVREHAAISLVLVLAASMVAYPPGSTAYPYRDYRCPGYLAQGVLYGGQPE